MKQSRSLLVAAACAAFAIPVQAQGGGAPPVAPATAPVDSTVGLCATTSPHRWCWGLLVGGVDPLGSLAKYAANGLQIGALGQLAITPRWRVRADAAYQGLHARDNGSGAVFFEPNVRMITADAIWEGTDEHSGLLHPYLIGGVGAYQLRLVQTCYTYCNVDYSRTTLAGGVNAGAGVRVVFPGHWNASGFTGFVEARWHRVSGAASPSNDRSTTFVPISIGFLAH